MREALKEGYLVARGAEPQPGQEDLVEKIITAFKRRGKIGSQGITGFLKFSVWWRGHHLAYVHNTAWNKGVKDFGDQLRSILAPKDYINHGLAGHDRYFQMAWEIQDALIDWVNEK